MAMDVRSENDVVQDRRSVKPTAAIRFGIPKRR